MISNNASEQVELHISCQDLKGVQVFGLSDLFVKVLTEKQGAWIDVGRTEVIGLELNPKFTHTIPIDFIFETKQSLRFQVWDDSNKADGLISSVETTLGSVMGARKQTKVLELKGKDGAGAGKITIIGHRVEKPKTQSPENDKPTFIDYLKGGEQLQLVTAIDFTASNGDPKDKSSLHAIQPNKMNEYQAALFYVGQIVLNYDYDQMVPMYGFGGVPRFPNSSRSWDVSHCFSCTGDANVDQVAGMKGIMDAYAYALMNVELAGPTYFNPIIQEAMKACREHKKNDADIYKILLIITDGEIHDMDSTIDSIVSAAELPISIIIIGVGDADFSNMEILDGDEGLVNSKGQTAPRDLVQFVPFRKYQNDVNALAQHVLAEIPDQLVKYKQLIGKKPKIAH